MRELGEIHAVVFLGTEECDTEDLRPIELLGGMLCEEMIDLLCEFFLILAFYLDCDLLTLLDVET